MKWNSFRLAFMDFRKLSKIRIKKTSLGWFLNNGALGRIRTPDPLVRSQILYPTELPAHAFKAANDECI